MKLRSPTPADYIHIAAWIPDAAVCRLWAGPRVPFPFMAEELSELLVLEGGVSYCVGDRELLGFGQYWPRPDGSAHLLRVIVSPQRRGEGIGRALCSQLVACAIGAGATSVTLNVYPENVAAVALYESLGFRRDDSKLLHDSIFMRVARA